MTAHRFLHSHDGARATHPSTRWLLPLALVATACTSEVAGGGASIDPVDRASLARAGKADGDDLCARYGWYDDYDGYCDDRWGYCAQPDPDCGPDPDACGDTEQSAGMTWSGDPSEGCVLVEEPEPSPTVISAGGAHTCAAIAGRVYCWGKNREGQLGLADPAWDPGRAVYLDQFAAAEIDVSGRGVVSVAAGRAHTCALDAAGAVLCWGSNNRGQLGRNGADDPAAERPLLRHSDRAEVVFGLDAAMVSVTAGGSHTCALSEAGAVVCWGANDTFQLGNSAEHSYLTRPVPVHGLGSGAVAIAAGDAHTCALLEDGSVSCWGSNYFGQLGIGSIAGSGHRASPGYYVPQRVQGLPGDVVSISAGSTHTCALSAAGTVSCWGDNRYRQIGTYSETVTTAYPAYGLTDAVEVSAGGGLTCVVTSAGAAQCWGTSVLDGDGWGGDGGSSRRVSVVGLASGVQALSVGGSHSCAASSSGSIHCWGYNDYGQLGATTDRVLMTRPVEVDGL